MTKSGYAQKTQKRLRKTIEFDRFTDAPVIAWFSAAPNASEAIRQACWSAYVQEQSGGSDDLPAARIDLEAIRQVVDERLKACMADMRLVFQNVIDAAVIHPVGAGPFPRASPAGDDDDPLENLVNAFDFDLEEEPPEND